MHLSVYCECLFLTSEYSSIFSFKNINNFLLYMKAAKGIAKSIVQFDFGERKLQHF